jgi:hypothetical protein
VIKQRVLELMPTAAVFLDVDDLEDISALEGYIHATRLVLVFVSASYFQSRCVEYALKAK